MASLCVLSNLLKGISMITFGATKSTSKATGSTSSIGSLLGVVIGCRLTIRREIGVEAICT